MTDYLKAAGLLPYLDQLGFDVVGYGCTTCIGNSGPLPGDRGSHARERSGRRSVLSGNRNFEARVHQNVKANFLMSPPLVVAFALAGRVPFDVEKDPIGAGKDGPVYLKDLWPSNEEVAALLHHSTDASAYKSYADVGANNPKWNEVTAPSGEVYDGTRPPPTSRSRPSSSMKPVPARSSRARARSASSATPSPPTTSARRRHQADIARRCLPDRAQGAAKPISTATARAAATTES